MWRNTHSYGIDLSFDKKCVAYKEAIEPNDVS